MGEETSKDARKTLLFFTNSEYGQANVLLAVMYELLLRSKYNVHIASFAPLAKRIDELNKFVSAHSEGKASAATFHLVDGPSTQEALIEREEPIGPFPPGIRGALSCYKHTLPAMATTWTFDVYMEGYTTCLNIIDEVLPDLVVCDPIFSQGLEASRTRSKPYVILAPNTFRHILPKQQPLFPTFFRMPAISTAFPYPVPWYLIPANIFLKISLVFILITHPKLKELVNQRLARSLPRLPAPFTLWNPESTYLVPSIPETDFPCANIPPNVFGCGPILLPEPPIASTDPKLLAWLEQGPTVLINLGSHIRMDDRNAREFAGALKVLLDSRPDVQVLWKLKRSGGAGIGGNVKSGTSGSGEVTDASLGAIESEMARGRVRVEQWLSVDPIAVLQSGHVACSVHHGGSNSFHEALSAGVPQVVLPVWLDTFDHANRVEYLGIGVYGSRQNAPRVESGELAGALMRVMGVGEEAARMRTRAKEFAAMTAKVGGRVKATEKIIEVLERS